jgi:hypothetical protein
VVLLAYLAALIFRADAVPAGLNNDAAEEALRGLYLVDGHHFEVITVAIGNSAETLYLYLMGAAAHLFGPTTLAIHALSWAFAIGCVWMVWRLTERVDSGIPAAIPLVTAACSIWLFHYARSGLRAISAPFFLCAFTLLLDRVERDSRRWVGILCGAVLGLSLYGYTSARILPIAFCLFVAVQFLRRQDPAPELARRYVPVLAGAFLASIPNLVFFVRHPHEFLKRGDYVFVGSTSDRVDNVIATALFPIHYPAKYNTVFGQDHFFDGVSSALVSSGFSPIHLLYAAAAIFGLYWCRRHLRNPVVLFLATAWMTAIGTLGAAGPSLTRLLVILPAILVFAALGFAGVARIHPKLRIAVVALILLVGAADGYSYLSGRAEAPEQYAPAATAIGQEAAAIAARGQSVLCIVSKNANVARFLTHGYAARMRVVEFYARPLDPREIPWNEMRPDVLLVENTTAFRDFVAGFGGAAQSGADGQFYVIRASQNARKD